jgi:transcriptional regulator with XRE-family HTH domain
MAQASIGQRLQNVRKRRGLSQRELAGLSQVSLSLIRKVEQGERSDVRMETLRKLAVALRVPTTALIDRPDADEADDATVDRWKPVRDALQGKPMAQPEEAATAEGVAGDVATAMPLFSSDRYLELAAMLPALIRDADTLVETSPEGRSIRGRLLHLTGWLLTQTRQFTAADMALQQALDDAPDRLDAAAIVNTTCWLLIRQGKISETLDLASAWADDVEPRMSRATMAELAAWGWLLIRISTAAVRNNQPGDAEDAIKLARAAAVAMGREYAAPADFLRTFGPVTVGMKRTENMMVLDRPDQVLRLADAIHPGGLRPTSNNRNRHSLDIAKAHVRLRNYAEAFETLQDIERSSPQWIVNQRLARDILSDIVQKRRTLTPEMRGLADAINLDL